MKIAIIPDSLRAAIDEKLDKAYAQIPEAAIDREIHYHYLLNYFDEHGVIPDFEFFKRDKDG